MDARDDAGAAPVHGPGNGGLPPGLRIRLSVLSVVPGLLVVPVFCVLAGVGAVGWSVLPALLAAPAVQAAFAHVCTPR